MSKETAVVDPKEFGLTTEQAASIEKTFLPKIQERQALSVIFNQLINANITPELCKQAGEVRKKLVKVRTGIAEVHKVQKAYFLAGGRFVDSWKNKETLPIEQMEERLLEIETHFVRIERAAKRKLEEERLTEVKQYTQHPAPALADMADDVYQAYLKGLQIAFEAKVEEERIQREKQAEMDRKASLAYSRQMETKQLRQFIPNYDDLVFGEMTDEVYQQILKEANAAINAFKQEAERKEAELRIAREKELQLRKELEAKAKQEAEQKAKAEAEYIAKKIKEEEMKKAPVKSQMIAWVDSFVIPNLELDNETKLNIYQKFDSFKHWAKTQINNM